MGAIKKRKDLCLLYDSLPSKGTIIAFGFRMIFTKSDSVCHFVVGVACSVIYPLAVSSKHKDWADLVIDRAHIPEFNRNKHPDLKNKL